MPRLFYSHLASASTLQQPPIQDKVIASLHRLGFHEDYKGSASCLTALFFERWS